MTELETQLLEILKDYVSPINANCILSLAINRAKANPGFLRPSDRRAVLAELEKGTVLWLGDRAKGQELAARFRRLLEEEQGQRVTIAKPEASPLASRPSASGQGQSNVRVIPITLESDIVKARSAGREASKELGFSPGAQAKAATAISELARNIVMYAGRGEIRITILDGIKKGLEIIASDSGPGIPNLDDIFSGQHQSTRGLGIGLRGTRNLMDTMDVETGKGTGTKVVARLYLR